MKAASSKKSLYRPPWPTKLDTFHHWEKEDVWEKHIGDVVDRLVQQGQRSFLRESRLQDPHLAFRSTAWKKARRLGVELFDLRARFRLVYVNIGMTVSRVMMCVVPCRILRRSHW
jgi:hypothetical protein